MQTLRPFKDLPEVSNEPCLEYPGNWFVYFPSKNGTSINTTEAFSSLEEAKEKALKIIHAYQDEGLEFSPYRFCIWWSSSDDDPRLQRAWFSHTYRAGQFNAFGTFIPISW